MIAKTDPLEDRLAYILGSTKTDYFRPVSVALVVILRADILKKR